MFRKILPQQFSLKTHHEWVQYKLIKKKTLEMMLWIYFFYLKMQIS
jgi:hypothetical protein